MYKKKYSKAYLQAPHQYRLAIIALLTSFTWVLALRESAFANTVKITDHRANLDNQSITAPSQANLSQANLLTKLKLAQTPTNPVPPGADIPPPQDVIPSTPQPLPDIETPAPSPKLPPPEELLNPQTPTPNSEIDTGDVPDRIFVEKFVVEGSTIFSQKKFEEILEKYTGKELSFAELLQARSQVTKLYLDNGYSTTGAVIPPQTLTDGVVTIKVIEGEIEAIEVSGLERLNPNYIRSRLALSGRTPVNVPKILEGLRTLQLNPLIENLSAELSAGSRIGANVLEVRVQEADTFSTQITLDNGRSPSVGSFRRRLQVEERNLFGLGDTLSVGYTNTDGSNGFDASYILPINPRNGTVSFSYGTTSSDVIEEPFNELDIESYSRYYELTYRQPLFQSPSEEFSLGFIASHRQSETSLLDIPFGLSLGADDQGRTRVSALRFFQEWTKRDSTQVFAARSQFNIGIGAFDATSNDDEPDSQFYTWRGQAQWVRLLAPDTLFLIRGDMQIADRPLLATEQIALGGLGSTRGYRQDFLLADNGATLTAEVRLPIWKQKQNTLHVIPFIDFGTAWNHSGNEADLEDSTLASLGLGLQLNLGNSLNARIDYGIPLISVDSRRNTWQENGIYFTISTTPF